MRQLFVFVLSTTLLASPSTLRAQSVASGEPAGYREAIGEALQEFELGNYSEAREQFRVAHELSPSARTLRGLGFAEFELRNYPASVRYLEQALGSRIKPLTSEMRKEAETILDRARGYVGEVVLELEPAAATVTLDGHPLERSHDHPLLLPIGDHVLEFSATGHMTQRRGISVKGRQQQSLIVALDALVAATQPSRVEAPIEAERRPDGTPLYKRWWLWTTVGALAAAAGVTTFLLVRRSQQTRYEYEPAHSDHVPSGFAGGLQLPPPR